MHIGSPVFRAEHRLPSGESMTVGIIAESARRHATHLSFPDFRILFLLSGSGFARSAGVEVPLEAGALLLRPSRREHEVHRSGSWREFYVTLPSWFEPTLGALGLPGSGCLHPGVSSEILAAAGRLVAAVTCGAASATVVARVLDFLDASTHVPIGTRVQRTTLERLEQARAFLSSDAGFSASLGDAAGRAGMRTEAFRKAFVRAYGVSPTAFRIESRISAARDYLSELDRPVGDIAEALGYPDQFAFSRQFRSVTGESPTAFRAAIRS